MSKWDPTGWPLLATDCPYRSWQLSCRALKVILMNALQCWGMLSDLGQVMSSRFFWESRPYPGGDCCKTANGEGGQKEVRDIAERQRCLCWGLKDVGRGIKTQDYPDFKTDVPQARNQLW